jgi:hypothetical protein
MTPPPEMAVGQGYTMPYEMLRADSDLVQVKLKGIKPGLHGGVLAEPQPAAEASMALATAGKRSTLPTLGTRSR